MIQITCYLVFCSLWGNVGDIRRVSITPHCSSFLCLTAVCGSTSCGILFPLQFVEMCYVGLGWVSTPKLITRNISPHDGWLRRWLFNVHIFPKKQLGKIETELTTSWKLICLYLPFPSFNTLFPCGGIFFLWFKLCVDNNLCLGLSDLMACSLKIKVEILTRLESERHLHPIDIASSQKWPYLAPLYQVSFSVLQWTLYKTLRSPCLERRNTVIFS